MQWVLTLVLLKRTKFELRTVAHQICELEPPNKIRQDLSEALHTFSGLLTLAPISSLRNCNIAFHLLSDRRLCFVARGFRRIDP